MQNSQSSRSSLFSTLIYKATLCLVFLLFYLTTFGQNQLKFYPTYGVSNHSGPADLSIEKATYFVENNQLWFEIFIKDDEVILKNGELNSDHLEFWFTVNEKTDVLYSMHTPEEYTDWYYYETEGQQADLPTMKKQFRTDYIEFESWQYNDVDSAFYTADVKTKKEFSGTVHWGVYEDTTVMYDLEFYDYIPDQLVAPPANKAVYQKREDGYSVKVAFTPEQLLFVKRSKVQSQKLNIVVFDQDASGKSLHTLTTNYSWGEVKDFPSLPLNPPLTIDVSDTYIDYESSARLHLYYYEDGKWKTSNPADNRIRFYQPHYFITWEAQELSRTEVFIGKHRLYYYDELRLLFFPQSKYWINTDYELEQLKDVNTILFKDSSLAFYNSLSFMQNTYGHGPCGGCDHEQTDIYLLSEKGPQLILSADVNMGNLVCIWREHDIELAEEWIPEFDKQNWNSELEQLTVPVYNERGESTTPKSMLISWDKEWKPVIELVDR